MRTKHVLSLHFLLTSGTRFSGSVKWFCLVVFFLLCGLSEIQAQQAMDYSIQANIIYRFTKYVDWPENKKSGDFIIGIVGETPLYDELKTFVANKTAGSQKIIVKKFSPSASSFACHILFISEDASGSMKKISSTSAGIPILLLSETEGLIRKGSCINFVIIQERLKLEINKTNIEQRNLGIATELLSLGTIVK